MAFSAQPDHGQNDRKQRDLSNLVKIPNRDRTKFVPNPAAKPFVPSSNFDKSTRSNKTWSTAHRGQSSLLQFERNGNYYNNRSILKVALPVSSITKAFKNGSLTNGSLMNGPLTNGPLTNGIAENTFHSHTSVTNGIAVEKSQSQPGKHIALHLLSKVLDDETIFNFNSIDESSTITEPFSSVPGFFPSGQDFDGTAHSWPLSSTTNHSQPAPSTCTSIPGIPPNIGSFPGQNIWSHEFNNQEATPPQSPLDTSPSSSYTEYCPPTFHKPIRPNSLPDYDRFSPLVNGFLDDQSPYPSPTGQSYSSSNASPHQSFLPIQEPYCNGKSQQSCESGYVSNSNGSYYNTQMSPSSTQCYVPDSSPEMQAFILPLSTPGSQYTSSPSLSPSSPPLGQMKLDLKQFSPDPDNITPTKSKQQGFRDKCFQNPSCKRENGYLAYSSLQRTKSPFTSELHMRLDDCYEQLRYLEKDRKKAEAEISHLWSSRKLSSPGNCVSLRLPPNPSRVDKMVVDQLREHAKVEALVSRIERIRHSPLHLSISESVDQWQQSIKELQVKRREEISSCNNNILGRSRLCSASRFQDGSDLQALISAVKDVCGQTRAIRTTVWCAVHLVTCENIPRPSSFAESESSTSTSENALEGTGEVS